ncbi:MAG: iron uptake porin [Microcoleaceae cyanobacterium]
MAYWLFSPVILGASLIASSTVAAEVTPPETSFQAQVSPSTDTVHPSVSQNFESSPQVPVTDLEAMDLSNSVDVNTLEQLNQYSREGQGKNKQSQVTSVSQFSDVQPTDWAFQALQSLVERYGCIAGYPDGTFKGNRALTRYEFAAGVNACLERVNELIGAATAELVTREDLAILQRLMEEFAAELAALRGRVTALEARAAELEANQFSTTTKLTGEVLIFAADTFGERALFNVNGDQGPDGTGLVGENDDPTQTTASARARLNFNTSFTGQDRLRVRLEFKNVPRFSNTDLTNTLMSRLITDGSTNAFELNELYYRFPVANGSGQIYIGANDLDLDDILDPISPFDSTGSGAVSRFGRYTPTSYRGPEGTGVGFKYAFSDAFQVNLGYLADNAADANDGAGLFNGAYSAAIQFLISPTDTIDFSIAYNRRYFTEGDVSVSGSTGSFIANRPFGENATTSDNLGVELNWAITNSFELGGWFGATWADQKNGGNDNATILNWAVTLAFPDLLKEGSLGGIVVGMPPKVTSHDIDELEDNDTSLHIEGFYRFKLNEYIAITPGLFVVTNPEHNEENDTVFVGVVRTQFRF